jgi:glucokinase
MNVLSVTGTAIGIDIGGTKINAGRFDIEPQPATFGAFDDIQSAPTPDQTEAFLGTLSTMINELSTRSDTPIHAVGIATAGIVDPNRGMILGATGNLPAVRGPFNLSSAITQRTGKHVHVENDANAAAYGEYRAGAAQGYRDVLMVTLGTGVGGGLVQDGKIIEGAHFSGGEVGHIAISIGHDRQCTCGRWDCWEAYASGTGLANTARAILRENGLSPNARSILKGRAVEDVSTHDVIAALKEQNPLAREMMDQWHYHISVGLGNLLNVLDPEIVVVGGGMAQFLEYDLLRRFLQERLMVAVDSVRIVPAVLGNHAGMIGAAYLALEHRD